MSYNFPRYQQVPKIGGHHVPETKNSHPIIKWHPYKKYIKPNKIFGIWIKRYSPPWLFFFEFAILLLFIFLTVAVQQITIPFFQDFGKAVDNYFLEGYEISEDTQSDSYGERRIYTQTDFLDVFNSTVYRFFDFASTFPCSYQLTQSTNLTITVAYIDEDNNDQYEIYEITSENKEEASEISEKYISTFLSFDLHMLFTIELPKDFHQILSAGVTSSFDNFERTGIILWDNGHERSSQQLKDSLKNATTNFILSISIVIVIFLFISILLQLYSIYRLYTYSKIKAAKERVTPYTYFKMKLSYWEPVTLLININSLVSMLIYLLCGQNISEILPWPHFLLSWASFIHPFIIFRYLQLNPSTFIVVRMIANASITLMQFLVGCLPFFFAFLVLGVSCFGWYSPIICSAREGAKLLIASSYGDYLLDGYDGLTDFADKDEIIPSAYLTIWIFNGLGIWFYVVLAILQAALIEEVHKARDEEIEEGADEEKMEAEDPLPWFQFVIDR